MWQTYAIDGRRVEVQRTADGIWRVRCAGGPEVADVDLRLALAAAVGPESDMVGGGLSRREWESWIDDRARQLEGESGDA